MTEEEEIEKYPSNFRDGNRLVSGRLNCNRAKGYYIYFEWRPDSEIYRLHTIPRYKIKREFIEDKSIDSGIERIQLIADLYHDQSEEYERSEYSLYKQHVVSSKDEDS